VSDSSIAPLNFQRPMRTVLARKSAAHSTAWLLSASCALNRTTSATLLSDRYSHLPSIRIPSAASVAISGVVVPSVRSLPVLARISERFLIVRISSARLSRAALSNGIGTHCRTQKG